MIPTIHSSQSEKHTKKKKGIGGVFLVFYYTPLGWIQDVTGPRDQRLRCCCFPLLFQIQEDAEENGNEWRTPRRVTG